MSPGNSTSYLNCDGVTGFDYSTYSTIKLDYYLQTLPSGTEFGLQVFDLGDFSNATAFSSTTGSQLTLTADLSTLTSKTNCGIVFSVGDISGLSAGAYDVYFDNLRGTP